MVFPKEPLAFPHFQRLCKQNIDYPRLLLWEFSNEFARTVGDRCLMIDWYLRSTFLYSKPSLLIGMELHRAWVSKSDKTIVSTTSLNWCQPVPPQACDKLSWARKSKRFLVGPTSLTWNEFVPAQAWENIHSRDEIELSPSSNAFSQLDFFHWSPIHR